MSTYTISSLRKALGLSTANQVRNRIEAIKDILQEHLRRGPNNQILISESGVDLLRRLQELYDSGLTMTEASSILRANSFIDDSSASSVSYRSISNRTIPPPSDPRVDRLQAEIAALRGRVSFLENLLATQKTPSHSAQWWETLREDLDAD